MNVCQFISHFSKSDIKFLEELGEKMILFFSYLGNLTLNSLREAYFFVFLNVRRLNPIVSHPNGWAMLPTGNDL